MSEPDPTPSPSRTPQLVALAVALAGLWPHAHALPLHPESRDAVMWITRSALDRPNALSWVFLEPHFDIVYRPVTALSFSLVGLLVGLAPLLQRIVDLGTHLGASLAVFALVRALAPRLSPWGAVAAVALFVAHPVTQEVVPHLARRSYSLAALWSVLGLWAVVRWPARPLWGVAALALGALANETAYVALPVAALLLWTRTTGRGRAVAIGTVGAATAVLVTLRMAVVGSVGGYNPEVDVWARLPEVLASACAGVLWLPMSWPAAAAAVAVVATTAGVAAWAGRGDHRGDYVGAPLAVLAVWMVGIVVLYLPQGVWFPRQIYPLVAPLACAFGLAVGAAVVGTRPVHRGLAGWLAVLGLACVVAGPVVRGPDPIKRAAWQRQDAVIDDLDAYLGTLKPRDRVVAVIPVYPVPEVVALRSRETHMALGRHWLGWLRARRGRRLAHLGAVTTDPLAAGAAFSVADGVPPQVSWLHDPPPSESQGLWLYLHDGTAGTASGGAP